MADYRARAHNRIDTSNPWGSWIDEKMYNKYRAPGASGKTLCGNWQEEVVLEGDMDAAGHSMALLRPKGRHLTGGFESTAYLISPIETAERKAAAETTVRDSFNERNGDVASQAKPPLGARSALRAEMIVAEARALVADAAMKEAERSRGGAVRSTYEDTLAGKRVKPPPVDPRVLEAPYADDAPVTLYTGNPRSGAKMVVPGKTEAAGAGNPHGRSTHFTWSKFAIPSFELGKR